MTRVVEIRDGKLYEYQGNYSFFLEKREELLLHDIPPSPEKSAPSSSSPADEEQLGRKSREQKRLDAEVRSRLSARKRTVLQALEPVENRISTLEAEKKQLELALCDPKTLENSGAVQETLQRLGNIGKELEALLPRWEELMAEMEAAVLEPS